MSIKTYAFYVFYDETIFSILVYILALYVIYMVVKKYRGEIRVKHKPLICAVIVIAMIIFNLCTPLTGKYSGVVVGNKMPSNKIEYYSFMIKDIIGNKTENIMLSSEDIKIRSHEMNVTNGRVRTKKTVYKMEYVGKDNKTYSFYITEKQKNNLALILESMYSNKITYYPNSGVVQYVNGVTLNDTEKIKIQIALYKAAEK